MYDLVFHRVGSPDEADELWSVLQSEHVEACITNVCLNRISAYLFADKGREVAEVVTEEIRDVLEVVYIEADCIQGARSISALNFDLAVEVICAIKANCLAYVTNLDLPPHFIFSGVRLLRIQDVLERSQFEATLQFSELASQRALLAHDTLQIKRLNELYTRKIRARREDFFQDKNRLAENDLRFSNLKYLNLNSVNLSEIDLSGANISFSKLIETQLRNSLLVRSVIVRSNLQRANLSGACARYVNFRESDLSWASLYKACLDCAILDGAIFICTDLSEATLSTSSWFRAKMSKANMESANLKNSLFVDAVIKNSNLVSANLTGSNLCGSILRHSNFRSAKLFRAKIKCADLTHADLSYSDLTEADLRGANLSKVKFTGARLYNTRIDRVKGLSSKQKAGLIERGAICCEENKALFSVSNRSF